MKARLHHIGLVLDEQAPIIDCLACLDLLPSTSGHPDPLQKVNALFMGILPGQDVHLELVEPLDEDSPVSSFLAKKGGGLHHLCLEVDDMEEACTRLKGRGHAMVCPPVDCQGMDNSFPLLKRKSSQVAFFLCKGGLLLELLFRGGE